MCSQNVDTEGSTDDKWRLLQKDMVPPFAQQNTDNDTYALPFVVHKCVIEISPKGTRLLYSPATMLYSTASPHQSWGRSHHMTSYVTCSGVILTEPMPDQVHIAVVE